MTGTVRMVSTAALFGSLLGACAGAAQGEAPSGGDPICASGGACEEQVELTSAEHAAGDIHYTDVPPAGGPHDGCWGDFGVHDAPLAPERFVHNLEHGAIVYLYHCPSGCAGEVTKLASLVRARSWAILTAYETPMPDRFAAVAWGYRLLTSELDLGAFAAFYEAHADRAPESVPSGAPSGCR